MRRLYVLLFWFTVAAASSLPAQANPVDSLAPGYWYEAPGTMMKDVAPLPYDSRVQNVIDAWSGGAFDTKRDRLIVWGGGHGDYWGNEVYVFDVNTLKWQRLNDPYWPAKDFGWGVSATVFPDGSPGSRHTYDGMVYLPVQDRLWESGGSIWRSGNGVHDTEEFDFNTLKWQQMADAPHASNGVATGYDPVTGHVFMFWCGWLTEYDPVANTWTTRGQDACISSLVAAVDPVNRKFVVIGRGKAYVYTISSSGTMSQQNLNAAGAGASVMMNANAPGLVYDPAIKKLVGWAGGTDVYTLDLSVSPPVWTRVPAAAGNTVTPTPPAPNGTYGRWQYIPSKNAFVVVNGVDQDVFFYKLPSSLPAPDLTPPVSTLPVVPAATLSLGVDKASVVSGGSVSLT
ncbi:MAG: hypothetical protein B7Z66_07905, partial [Chromatiales bacterium 21-64-14]